MFWVQSYFCSFLDLKYFPFFMVAVAVISFICFLRLIMRADSLGKETLFYILLVFILILLFKKNYCILENGYYGYYLKVDVFSLSAFEIIFSAIIFYFAFGFFFGFLYLISMLIKAAARNFVLYISLVKERCRLISLRVKEKNKLKKIKIKIKIALEAEQKTIEKALPQISARELRLAKSRGQFRNQNFDQEG